MRSVKRPAFTLVEVVFSLLVTALCVVAIGDVLQSCKKLTAQPRTIMAQHSDIYYSKLQFEKFVNSAKYCECRSECGGERFYFYLQKGAKPNPKCDHGYRLEKYWDMIRMTNASGQGHVPLLLGVKRAHFSSRGRLLIIKVVQTNGSHTDLVCKLPPPPPKKKKDEKKDEHKKKGKRAAVKHAPAAGLPAAG